MPEADSILVVSVPPLGEQKQTQTQLNTWYVKPGRTVRAGDELAELVTDKAAFDLPSPESGAVVELLVAEGAEVRAGQPLLKLRVPPPQAGNTV